MIDETERMITDLENENAALRSENIRMTEITQANGGPRPGLAESAILLLEPGESILIPYEGAAQCSIGHASHKIKEALGWELEARSEGQATRVTRLTTEKGITFGALENGERFCFHDDDEEHIKGERWDRDREKYVTGCLNLADGRWAEAESSPTPSLSAGLRVRRSTSCGEETR